MTSFRFFGRIQFERHEVLQSDDAQGAPFDDSLPRRLDRLAPQRRSSSAPGQRIPIVDELHRLEARARHLEHSAERVFRVGKLELRLESSLQHGALDFSEIGERIREAGEIEIPRGPHVTVHREGHRADHGGLDSARREDLGDLLGRLESTRFAARRFGQSLGPSLSSPSARGFQVAQISWPNRRASKILSRADISASLRNSFRAAASWLLLGRCP